MEPMTIATIISTVAALGAWAEALRVRAATQANAVANAVGAARKALMNTKAYLGSISQGIDRNLAEEEALSSLWMDASIAFLAVDTSLAERLELKAESWKQPDKWPRARVEEAGIVIAEVERQLADIHRTLVVQGPPGFV